MRDGTGTRAPRRAGRPTIEVLLEQSAMRAELRDDVRRGLATTPKELPARWLYDERGSQLFDAITRLPEYYPTERERELLQAHAAQVARLARPETLVELGSGTSDKTRTLLDALLAEGDLRRFVPFDVSEKTLRAAAGLLHELYPELRVHAIVADFEHQLELLPPGGRRLVAFLGSTIGNLPPAARARFLRTIAFVLEPDGWLLLGLDLVKDPERLQLAYDDPGGVTADFELNLLLRLNRELGASFDREAFAYAARWDPRHEWMELGLRSLCDQVVPIPAVGIEARFAAGELLRTEISAKFRRAGAERELVAAGLELVRFWSDPADDFALVLARRRA